MFSYSGGNGDGGDKANKTESLSQMTSSQSIDGSSYELTPPPEYDMDDLPQIEITPYARKNTFIKHDESNENLNENDFRNYLSENKSRASSPVQTLNTITTEASSYKTADNTQTNERSKNKETPHDSWNTTQSSITDRSGAFLDNAATVKRKPIQRAEPDLRRFRQQGNTTFPTSSETLHSIKKVGNTTFAAPHSLVEIQKPSDVKDQEVNSDKVNAAHKASTRKRKRNSPDRRVGLKGKATGKKPSKLRKPTQVKLLTPRRLRSNKILPSGWVSYKNMK